MQKRIHNVPIDWVDETELPGILNKFVQTKKPHQITTVNPEFIVLADTQDDFRNVLQGSDLSLADGTGIVLAQTYLDTRPTGSRLGRIGRFLSIGVRYLFVPQRFAYKRITGVDLTNYILQLAEVHHWSVYLLGAKPGVAQKASLVWREAYPDILIAGVSSGNPDDPEVVSAIQAEKPDVLLVAYGAPKQDMFIAKHKHELDVPIMVGVGGTFDYAAGEAFRAPALIRMVGLEWLVRLIFQPRRIGRIYRSTVGFIALITRES